MKHKIYSADFMQKYVLKYCVAEANMMSQSRLVFLGMFYLSSAIKIYVAELFVAHLHISY